MSSTKKVTIKLKSDPKVFKKILVPRSLAELKTQIKNQFKLANEGQIKGIVNEKSVTITKTEQIKNDDVIFIITEAQISSKPSEKVPSLPQPTEKVIPPPQPTEKVIPPPQPTEKVIPPPQPTEKVIPPPPPKVEPPKNVVQKEIPPVESKEEEKVEEEEEEEEEDTNKTIIKLLDSDDDDTFNVPKKNETFEVLDKKDTSFKFDSNSRGEEEEILLIVEEEEEENDFQFQVTEEEEIEEEEDEQPIQKPKPKIENIPEKEKPSEKVVEVKKVEPPQEKPKTPEISKPVQKVEPPKEKPKTPEVPVQKVEPPQEKPKTPEVPVQKVEIPKEKPKTPETSPSVQKVEPPKEKPKTLETSPSIQKVEPPKEKPKTPEVPVQKVEPPKEKPKTPEIPKEVETPSISHHFERNVRSVLDHNHENDAEIEPFPYRSFRLSVSESDFIKKSNVCQVPTFALKLSEEIVRYQKLQEDYKIGCFEKMIGPLPDPNFITKAVELELDSSTFHYLSLHKAIIGPPKSGKSSFFKTMVFQASKRIVFLHQNMFVFFLDLLPIKDTITNIRSLYTNFITSFFEQLSFQKLPMNYQSFSNQKKLKSFSQILSEYFVSLPLSQTLQKIPSPFSHIEGNKQTSDSLFELAELLSNAFLEPQSQFLLQTVLSFPILLSKVFGFDEFLFAVDNLDCFDVDFDTNISIIEHFKPILMQNQFIVSCLNEQLFIDSLFPLDYKKRGWNPDLISTIGKSQRNKKKYRFLLQFHGENDGFVFRFDHCGGCSGFIYLWNQLEELAKDFLKETDFRKKGSLETKLQTKIQGAYSTFFSEKAIKTFTIETE